MKHPKVPKDIEIGECKISGQQSGIGIEKKAAKYDVLQMTTV